MQCNISGQQESEWHNILFHKIFCTLLDVLHEYYVWQYITEVLHEFLQYKLRFVPYSAATWKTLHWQWHLLHYFSFFLRAAAEFKGISFRTKLRKLW